MAMAMEPFTMSLNGTGLSNSNRLVTEPVHSSTIGPQKWSSNTVKTVKLSQSIVDRADRAIDIGKATDPLPTIREVLTELSNNEIKRYTREVCIDLVFILHQLYPILSHINCVKGKVSSGTAEAEFP